MVSATLYKSVIDWLYCCVFETSALQNQTPRPERLNCRPKKNNFCQNDLEKLPCLNKLFQLLGKLCFKHYPSVVSLYVRIVAAERSGHHNSTNVTFFLPLATTRVCWFNLYIGYYTYMLIFIVIHGCRVVYLQPALLYRSKPAPQISSTHFSQH